MGVPNKKSAGDDSWHAPVLPNPFLVVEESHDVVSTSASQKSEAHADKFDLVGSPTSELLENNFASDVGSYLPQPIPILDFDSASRSSPQPDATSADIETDLGASDPRLRGIKLFGAVFSELSTQLGDKFSTTALMRAAQQLIDLSKGEYVGVRHSEGAERAGYYSWDLVKALHSHPWHVVGVETYRIDHCDIDEFSPETFENAKIILQGWNEQTWEF